MSIFINSKVHLPSSCEKCPFNYADMSAGICMAADKTIDTRTYGRKRHPDCPLTELPAPHGRLIDADELLRQPMNTTNYPKNYVHNVPTIIEAEGADNE